MAMRPGRKVPPAQPGPTDPNVGGPQPAPLSGMARRPSQRPNIQLGTKAPPVLRAPKGNTGEPGR